MRSKKEIKQRIVHFENHNSLLDAQKDANYISENEWVRYTREFNLQIDMLKWILEIDNV